MTFPQNFDFSTAEHDQNSFAIMDVGYTPLSIPGYWERELALERMTPTSSYLCFSIQQTPLKILSRSRDGRLFVCACSQNLHVFKAGSSSSTSIPNLHHWSLFLGPISVDPQIVKNIIITDAMPMTITAHAISDPKMEDLLLNGPEEKSFPFHLPANTLLFETLDGMMGMVHMEGGPHNRLQFLVQGEMGTDAFRFYLHKHAQTRHYEISHAFEQHSVLMEPVDFIASFHGDVIAFPTVSSTVKRHGRPAFSVDKGPRTTRSPPLAEEDELQVPFSFTSNSFIFLTMGTTGKFCFDCYSENHPFQCTSGTMGSHSSSSDCVFQYTNLSNSVRDAQ